MASASAEGMRTATKRCQARRGWEVRGWMRLEGAGGQMEHGVHGGGADQGARRGPRHGRQRERSRSLRRWGGCRRCGGRKQVGGGQVQRGQGAVHSFKRELPVAVEEIGEMGLREAGLAG